MANPIDVAVSPDLLGGEEEKIYLASQWQLMWWRFRKHKLALISAIIVLLFYLVAVGAEFLAVYDPEVFDQRRLFAPPQRVRLWDSEEGRLHLRPFVYGNSQRRDPVTRRMLYSVDKSKKYPIQLFVEGDPYRFWGLFESRVRLFGVEGEGGTLFLLGTDQMGRDVFSRVVYGTRISLSIGLVGVTLSLTIGIVLGGLSGYYGGPVDLVIQRVIEFLRSMPTIPLWMSLAAALPLGWPPLRIYFMITVLISFIGWTVLARVVRGRFLALRAEDFVMAAQLAGAGEMRIILRHMVPSFASHIIASVSLSIPAMILSETSLSFLGLGLRPPTISWGVLLKDAQNVRTVALAPWLLMPGLAVVVAVLAFNFLGDGLRDAADPYAR